jgi:hypothetical protein
MSRRERIEGRMAAERACAEIIASSRSPVEARRRMRRLLTALRRFLRNN